MGNEDKIIKCQVHGCENEAEYFNPDSKLKYCEDCKNRLGGRIIYQSADKSKGISEKSQRLLKIKTEEKSFDIMGGE